MVKDGKVAGKHIWTPEEHRKLVELYPHLPTNQLEQHFPNRTQYSLRMRASLFGLKRLRQGTSRFVESHSLLNHLTDAERGYIAGLFDGEGTVVLSIGSRIKPTHMKHFNLSIHICSTSTAVVAWLNEKIPFAHNGTVRAGGGGGNPLQRLPLYRWNLSSRPAFAFVTELEPLLIIKRAEAQYVLKHWPTRFDLSEVERLAVHAGLKALRRIPYGAAQVSMEIVA